MNRSRRAFTMLELLLATALGALVIIATLGVFYQIDRTETLLARRAKDANELSNLRLVIERVTGNFVMSTDPLPARDPAAEQSGSRFGATRNARDPSAPPPVPRLILEPDPSVAGATMLRRAGADWNADATRVQRLEVVVSDSPVPEGEIDVFARARARMDGARKFYVRGDLSERRRNGGEDEGASGGKGSGGSSKGSGSSKSSSRGESSSGLSMKTLEMPTFGAGKERASGDSGKSSAAGGGAKDAKQQGGEGDTDRREAPGDDAAASDVAPVRAVRGAFELRPQEPTAEQWRRARERGEEPEAAWQMWWVPLPPRENGSPSPSIDEIMEAGEPFLIASNLRYVQWTMFDDNEHKSAMNATWEQQLPAHIEVAVETISGLNANWMFEVDWGRGPEVPPKPVEAGAKQAQPVDPSGAGVPNDGRGGVPSPTPTPQPPVRTPPTRQPVTPPRTPSAPGTKGVPASGPSPGNGGKAVR